MCLGLLIWSVITNSLHSMLALEGLVGTCLEGWMGDGYVDEHRGVPGRMGSVLVVQDRKTYDFHCL